MPEPARTESASPDPEIPLKLSEAMALLPPEVVLLLATPGETLHLHGDCSFCDVYKAVTSVKGHEVRTYDVMDALWKWHNVRRIPSLLDEGYFRCLAIYGAAAELLVNVRETLDA
jgi:hypothetical protein